MGNARNRAASLSTAIIVLGLAGCGGSSGTSTTHTSTNTTGGSASKATGVTAKTVTVGTVADLTGPIPGIFQGAVDGVKAYFAYVNSQGGVNGRMLVDDDKDSALNCATATQAETSLVGSVFAFVGSVGLYDACTTPTIAKNADVPNIGLAIDAKLAGLPNSFSPYPTPPGYRTGAYKYLIQHYGVSKMGFIAGAGAEEPTETDGYEAAQSVGATIAYKRFAGPTETDFTSDVVRMRQAGVDWVNLTFLNLPQAARVIQAMAAQNFKPKVIESDAAYTGSFLQLFSNPAVANGIIVTQPLARFLGEDAASNPAVSIFDTWMSKTNPSLKPDNYAVFAWESAEMFVQALKDAGPNPTRAAVLASLGKLHTFDGGGLQAPSDPASKTGPTCWTLLTIQDGKYEKDMPQGNGFTCDPGGFFAAQR